jgi:protein SCO1/2
MESSAGKIGTLVDQLLLYCYHYDPGKGSHRFVATNVVCVGGAVTVIALLGFVVLTLRRERRAPISKWRRSAGRPHVG